ncbi:MAG TPA: DUF3151 domain-containing protein [Leifsonia sp.]|jgi:hypothetical protein|nr:hypothetical protein [Microbacteriaceae bacterium]HEV7813256.1 DUF3151 domain-containing protein [Leifsonia sp.]
MTNNLLGASETRLPEEPAVLAAIANTGLDASNVVIAHPSSSLAWALLANNAFNAGKRLESYAFARVGYHRGLDALRQAGWKGHGPIPWSHAPNRGVLRSLFALRRAALAIGEQSEVDRLTEFLNDADPTAIERMDVEHAAR